LVDIHGQHDHQLLLKPGAQRELLDRYASLQPVTQQVAMAYKDWQTTEKQIALANTAGLQLAKEKSN
jgi:DNA repair protein RecN (Recombination protein N)